MRVRRTMIVIPLQADIECSAEEIFEVTVDARGQDRWLKRSSAFRGTVDISANPVAPGTTYREPGPFGVRNGTVTEFERASKITFDQPMTMRLHAGTVDVSLRYILSKGAESTHVERVVTLGVPRSLKFFSRCWCAHSGPKANGPCSRSTPRQTRFASRRAGRAPRRHENANPPCGSRSGRSSDGGLGTGLPTPNRDSA